eukprot:g4914.t1
MSKNAIVLCLVLATAACVFSSTSEDESRKLIISSRALLQSENATSPGPSPTPSPISSSAPSPSVAPISNRTSDEEPTETEEEVDEEAEDDDDEEEEEEEDEPRELTPEEREAAREEAALAAFAAAQERRANESRRIIRRAERVAEDVVERYLANGTYRGRIEIFQNLFQNAAGVAAKFALNTLIGDTPVGRYVSRNVHIAISRAIDAGYSTNVAEAIENAFTIFRNPGDHYNLLDSIAQRRVILERREEGSGCSFINRLFNDADAIAYDRGESMQFLQAISADEYLPLTECFLERCSGRAAACCTNARALRRGLCDCPTRRSTRCDFNLFANRPRTVWVCSSNSCGPNEKCLCAAPSS